MDAVREPKAGKGAKGREPNKTTRKPLKFPETAKRSKQKIW